MDQTEMQDFQAKLNLPCLVVQNLRDHRRTAAAMAEFNRDMRRRGAGVNVGATVSAPRHRGSPAATEGRMSQCFAAVPRYA